MKKTYFTSYFFAISFTSFLISSCVSSPSRNPSSNDQDARYLEALASSQLQNEIELDKAKSKSKLISTEKKKQTIAQAEANLKEINQNIEKWGERFQNDTPQTLEAKLQTPWRNEVEKIVFRDLKNYELTPGVSRVAFSMNRTLAKSYQIEFKNYFYSDFMKDRFSNMSIGSETKSQLALEFTFVCDGDFKISKSLMSVKGKAGKKTSFQLFDDGYNAENTSFVPSENVKSCQVDFYIPEEPMKKFGFQIIDDASFPTTQAPHQQMIHGCLLPKVEQEGSVEKFFLTKNFRSMTCPQVVQSVRTMPDAMDGFIAKLETLFGQPITQEWVAAYTPDTVLDLSKTPKFDEINLTYLVFRNDFVGSLLRRLLEHHAQKGTFVRILVADVIELDKDRASFQLLSSKYPNLKVQEYRWKSSRFFSLKDKFNSLHRDNHVKMFLTYSASNENLNTAIVGGRNIHDGFVFKDAVDLSKYPDLVQYPQDESYAYWRDMEYQMKDSAMVKSLLAHYMTLWEMDDETFYQRSLNLNIPTSQQVSAQYFESKEPLVRHLMSIPFKDQQSLERFYVDMFDSALKEINLSTPYFNITKPISDAITRALDRGVKMTLITRLDLKGDTVDFILSDVNKKAVNKFKDQFQVFEYTVPNEILHSKIVLVDGKLAFVGSVNLNRRSFIHDTENGILVYSPEFYQSMFEILGSYMKNSRLVQDKQKIRFVNKMILSIPLINDAL